MSADREWNDLALLLRLLRRDDESPATRVETLFAHLFKRGPAFTLASLPNWSLFQLEQAIDITIEIVARYAHDFHDLSVLDVTYYKREKRVRRHLDQQFSALFKERIARSGRPLPKPELITEEPIYYLEQQARAKSFPKARDGHARLDLLRSRFRLDLSHRIDTGPDSRRVLLPHEIR